MQFDLMQTVQAAGSTAILVEPIAYGAATLSEKFGAQGKVQLTVGVLLGGVLGAAGYIAQVGAPVDFAGWFVLVLFTLIAAFVPAGVYEANKAAAAKGVAKGVIVGNDAEPPQ